EKDPGAYEKLMYGLILSGLAMQMFGTTRPASGPEHHMSHCWEMGVLAHTDALHGEKVGVATLIVSKKYHEVLKQGISYLDTLLPNLEMMPKASLRKVIGEELWPLIEEQNAKDTLEGLTVDIIREKWDELTAIMATIPPYEELLTIYNSIGAMTTMEEIGLSDDLIDKSFMFAPYIRNRFTFMRIMSRKINNEFVTE
ncbi:MAG: iron-containing alcohol dehydrogenase, partial [Christensenellaceae bacterium]|nr:iron-containing alcohol dehydrogenase [Christensenellaceae bacterium]